MKAAVYVFTFFIGVAAVASGGYYRESVENSVRASITSSVPKGTSKTEAVQNLVNNSFTTYDDEAYHPRINGVDVEEVTATTEYHSIWGTFYVIEYIYFDKQ